MRATKPRSLPRPRGAPPAVGKSGHQQPSGKPQVRNGAELVRLLALPGATAVGSVLHLQRSAGNSAVSGLVRLVLSGQGPAATSEVEGALHGKTTARYKRRSLAHRAGAGEPRGGMRLPAVSPPASRLASGVGYGTSCVTSCARTRMTTRAGFAPTTAVRSSHSTSPDAAQPSCAPRSPPSTTPRPPSAKPTPTRCPPRSTPSPEKSTSTASDTAGRFLLRVASRMNSRASARSTRSEVRSHSPSWLACATRSQSNGSCRVSSGKSRMSSA